MVVHNPTSFHAIAQVTVKSTWQTSLCAALDGTPLSLLTILHQTLGNEIEDIDQITSTDSDQSNASGTRFQRLSRTKWLVNILPLLGPTIFEPSQPISSMHLITETTSVHSNDKKSL